VVLFTHRLRGMDLFKAPGIAETIDWAEALMALDKIALDPAAVADTIGVLLKYQDDVGALPPEVVTRLVADVAAESAA
jgi:MoxR-like ATPase